MKKVQTPPRVFTKEWNMEPDKALDTVSSIKQEARGETHHESLCGETHTLENQGTYRTGAPGSP